MDCITDALSFFRQSCGRWRSQRSQHHLLHRRAEAGASLVEVAMVEADDPRLTALAELHKMDPAAVVGGCHVRWSGSMAWDRAGENHDSETVFALLPDDTEGCQGFLLRDMGYSVKEPVAGRFRLDEEKSLWLSTNYEMMDSGECFWFAGPNTRLRTSTVQGLSNTASLCMETRVLDDHQPAPANQAVATTNSLLGW